MLLKGWKKSKGTLVHLNINTNNLSQKVKVYQKTINIKLMRSSLIIPAVDSIIPKASDWKQLSSNNTTIKK